MANLTESQTYDAGVYQLETTDPVVGGPDGISNAPLKNLANRTAYLKKHVDDIESGSFALPGYAKLNSPAFTGNPTAPNQAAGDNDTSIANTAFVRTAVRGYLTKTVSGNQNVVLTAAEASYPLINFNGALTGNINVIVPSEPGSWVFHNNSTGGFTITVKTAAGQGVPVPSAGTGIAAWTAGGDMIPVRVLSLAFPRNIQLTGDVNGSGAFSGETDISIPVTVADNSHFHSINTVDGLQSALDSKSPVISPAFSGNPTAPTPAQFDNDTSLATTAFVRRELGSHRFSASRSGELVLDVADIGAHILHGADSGPRGYTMPNLSTVPNGATIKITNLSGHDLILLQRSVGDIFISTSDGSGTGQNFYIKHGTTVVATKYSENAWLVTGSGDEYKSPLFANLISGYGYQKLPSGFLMQWGSFLAPIDGYATVTLPISFAYGFFGVFTQVQPTSAVNYAYPFCTATPLSLSQFQVRSYYNQSDVVVQWLAIGK
jgi:hypothetical protein